MGGGLAELQDIRWPKLAAHGCYTACSIPLKGVSSKHRVASLDGSAQRSNLRGAGLINSADTLQIANRLVAQREF